MYFFPIFIVCLWLFPVVSHILLPLSILAIWGITMGVKTLTGKQK